MGLGLIYKSNGKQTFLEYDKPCSCHHFYLIKASAKPRCGSRDFGKGWRSMLATMVGRRRKFLGFRWCKKAELTFETISFWRNIFYQYFQIFAIFMDEIL